MFFVDSNRVFWGKYGPTKSKTHWSKKNNDVRKEIAYKNVGRLRGHCENEGFFEKHVSVKKSQKKAELFLRANPVGPVINPTVLQRYG